ncbi:hypothetical protein GCM10009753_17000 [Streptantibioticus ferralitis]
MHVNGGAHGDTPFSSRGSGVAVAWRGVAWTAGPEGGSWNAPPAAGGAAGQELPYRAAVS